MTPESNAVVAVMLLMLIKRAIKHYAVARAVIVAVSVVNYCTKESVYMRFTHCLAKCDVCVVLNSCYCTYPCV
jgi:acyl-coenzyme A synthetase/AMP-(fatty) acid ligase